MLSRIQSYLNQPHPFNSGPERYMRSVLVFTFFVGFFLVFFQPFGLSELPGNLPIFAGLGFAGVTFVSMLVFLGLVLVFPNYFDDDHWTLGRDVFFTLLNFVVIAHANYFFTKSSLFEDLRMLDYSDMMISTFAVGFFPYMFIKLIGNIRLLKENTERARSLTTEIHDAQSHHMESSIPVTFQGENQGDALTIALDDLLFVQSSGNYIEVIYRDQGKLEKTLLRCSISAAEELLSTFPSVFRTHRKYVVNLNNVKEILGNSQGYRLLIEDGLEDIPVARTKNADFKVVIGKINT